MQPMSFDNRNLLDDNLDLPVDFGSLEMEGPEGEIEFSNASAWPDEIFLTTV